MGTSYNRKPPDSVNGKSAAKYQSVLARARCAALWRLYVQPRPPMRFLCQAYGVSQPTILKAVRALSNGNGEHAREAKPVETPSTAKPEATVTATVNDIVSRAKSSTDALRSIARGLPRFSHVGHGADWVVEGVLATLQRFSPFRGVSEAALVTVRRDARGMVADCFTGDCTPVGVVFAIDDRLCTLCEEESEEETEAAE